MILLDTLVLVWLASEPAKLSKKAGDAIRRASLGASVPPEILVTPAQRT